MIQIIACGNSLRRDDGAGLMLAEQLEKDWRARHLDVERLSVHQLTPELAVDLARDEVTAAVFVDTRAVLPGEPAFDLQVRPITTDRSSPSLGHHLNPETLLAYAQLFNKRQLPAYQITVPGINFGHGEGLSDRVKDLLVNSRLAGWPAD